MSTRYHFCLIDVATFELRATKTHISKAYVIIIGKEGWKGNS